MGDETIISSAEKTNEPEKINDDTIPPEAEEESQMNEVRMSNSPSKPQIVKKGINKINCS